MPFPRQKPPGLLAPLLIAACIAGCDHKVPETSVPADVFELAMARAEEGAHTEALDLFAQAEIQFHAIGRRDIELQAIVNQARIGRSLSLYRMVLEKAEFGAALARQLGDFRSEIALRSYQGGVYSDAGMLPASRRAFGEALRIAETFSEQASQAEGLNALGSAELVQNNLTGAADCFQKALSAAQSANAAVPQSNALAGIATVFKLQGKMNEAINSILQATRLLDHTEYPVESARLQLRLGELQQASRNPNAALSAFREGVNALRRARVSRSLEAQILFRIGRVYGANGRDDEERKYLASALDVAKRQGDRIAQAYLSFYMFKRTVDAIPRDQRAAQGSRIIQASLQHADQFRAILQKPGESAALGLAGQTYAAMGGVELAIPLLAAAASADRDRFLSTLDPDLHLPFAEALDVGHHQPRYSNALAALFCRLNKPEEALTALEVQRQAEFADHLDGVELMLRHPTLHRETARIREELTNVRLKGSEWSAGQSRETSPATARDIRVSVVAELKLIRARAARIAAQYPNYGPVVRSDTVPLAMVQRSVPRRNAVVQYIDDGREVFAVVLRRDRKAVVHISSSAASVRAQMDEYLALLQDPLVYGGEGGDASVSSMTKFATLSTALYDILIRPLENELDRGVVFVSSGITAAFPFHALEKQDRSGRVESLIEYMSVDYLPSLMSLAYPTRSTVRLRDVVAIGNPSGRNWSIDYELRDIRSFYRSADVLVGRDASWKNLKSSKADLLQLATEFSAGNSVFGTMVLATGESSEGSELHPFESMCTLEPSPLVLLTNQSGPEGVLGPTQAWLLRLNGTSDVFLNAWAADRKAAKFFSEYFYTHLSNGLAAGDAYRQALLNLLRTAGLNHPRSWAQFFHFGVG